MENLEGREYMSASVAMENGALVLRANSSTPSRMVVDLSRDGKYLVARLNGSYQTFPSAQVNTIEMFGSSKSDLLYVDPRIKTPSRLASGDGNDSVFGGAGNDTITTGNGNDRVRGNAGDDIINAGDGNNVLLGGAGNDSITAGNGSNVIVGGDGNDTLVAGQGKNTIRGDAGNDSLTGGSGNDTLMGGAGNDTLVGGVGRSILNGQGGTNTLVGGVKSHMHVGRRDRVSTAPPSVVADDAGDTSTTSAGGTTADSAGSTTTTDTTDGSSAGTSTGGSSNSGGTTTGGTSSGGTSTSTSTGATSSGGTSTGSTTSGGTSSTGTTGGGTTTGGTTSGATTLGGTTTGGTTSGGSTSGGTTTGGTTSGGTSTGSTQAATTQAVITFATQGGMAGTSVQVNALSSKLGTGDPLSTTYQWDFGDAGTHFNTLVGWNAAHIYSNPGVYTITLTMTDSAGKTLVVTSKVSIVNDTRKTIYLDLNGSDANNGSSPSNAVATLTRAAQLIGDNTELLIHAGQKFELANGLSLSPKNLLIDRYGTGAIPIIEKIVGTGQSIFNFGSSSDGILIRNIQFQTPFGLDSSYGRNKLNARALYVAGKNFAVEGCRFDNLDDGVNTAGQPTGVIVQDCWFGLGMRACCIWGEGTDQVYIGNTMLDSTREHLIRCSGIGVTRLLIEDNNLSRTNNEKGSLELRTTSWFYVRGNVINGGTLRIGLGLGPTPADTKWGVVEGNETYQIFANIRPGVQHLAFRDNVMHYDDGAAILLETQGSQAGRVTEDVRIDHNTVISDSTVAKFLKLDGPAKDISVTNNLLVGSNLKWVGDESGGIFVSDKDLSSFSTISDNVWPKMPANSAQAGDNYLWPVWSDIKDGFQSAQQWESLPQVHNDQYANADVSGDVYNITLNGVDAGANLQPYHPTANNQAA